MDNIRALGATTGSTDGRRLIFGVDRAVWTLAPRKDERGAWYEGVKAEGEIFMAAWHREDEKVSRFRDIERNRKADEITTTERGDGKTRGMKRRKTQK